MVAATITMRIQGGAGMQLIASRCHQQATLLCSKLSEINGVDVILAAPFFHEFVIRIANTNTHEVLSRLKSEFNIQGGYPLGKPFPEYHDCLLVNATELTTDAAISHYANALQHILG